MSSQRLKTSLQALALFLLLILARPAYAEPTADFKVTLPKIWQMKQEDRFIGYYRQNSPKSPVITIDKLEIDPQQTGFDFLASKRIKIESERARLFSALGFERYTIVSVEEHVAKNGHKYQVIQSRYLGVKGQEVQMYERQYAFGSTLFRIAYTEESPALNELEKIKQILDNVQPVVPKDWREPASETSSGRGNSTENPKGFMDNAAEKFSLANRNPEYCADVPEKDRYTSDNDRSFVGKMWQVVGGGASCLIDQVKALLVDLPTAIKDFAFDDQTRGQVLAAAGTLMSELVKHPIDTSQKIFNSLSESAGKSLPKFWCYNLHKKVEFLCNTGVTVAMAGSLLLKMPMAANLAAKMGNVFESTVKAGKAAGTMVRDAIGSGLEKTGNFVKATKTTLEEAPKKILEAGDATSGALKATEIAPRQTSIVKSLEQYARGKGKSFGPGGQAKLDALIVESSETSQATLLRDIETILKDTKDPAKADKLYKALNDLKWGKDGKTLDPEQFKAAHAEIYRLAHGFEGPAATKTTGTAVSALREKELAGTSSAAPAPPAAVDSQSAVATLRARGTDVPGRNLNELLPQLPANEQKLVVQKINGANSDQLKEIEKALSGWKGDNAEKISRDILNAKSQSPAGAETFRTREGWDFGMTRIEEQLSSLPSGAARDQILRDYRAVMNSKLSARQRSDLATEYSNLARKKPDKLPDVLAKKVADLKKKDLLGAEAPSAVPPTTAAAAPKSELSNLFKGNSSSVRTREGWDFGMTRIEEQLADLPTGAARDQILKDYRSVMNSKLSLDERKSLAKTYSGLAGENPEKLSTSLSEKVAELRKKELLGPEPRSAIPPAAAAKTDTAKLFSTESSQAGKAAGELQPYQKEVHTLLESDPAAKSKYDALMRNTSQANQEAVSADLTAALSGANRDKAIAELKSYGNATYVKPEKVAENLKKLSGKEASAAETSAPAKVGDKGDSSSVDWNATRRSTDFRESLSPSGKYYLNKVLEDSKVAGNEKKTQAILNEVKKATEAGKTAEAEEILAKYHPEGVIRVDGTLTLKGALGKEKIKTLPREWDARRIEKALKELNKGPSFAERMGRRWRGADPISGIKTSKFATDVSFGSGSAADIEQALKTLAARGGEEGKAGQEMLKKWYSLDPQAKKAAEDFVKNNSGNSGKFVQILEGYSRTDGVDSRNFISAVKTAERDLGTTAPASAGASTSAPATAAAPASKSSFAKTRDAAANVGEYVVQPTGTGAGLQAARVIAAPAAVAARNENVEQQRKAEGFFPADDDSPAAQAARLYRDPTTGRVVTPDERVKRKETQIIASASQDVTSPGELREQIKKLSQVTDGQYQKLLEQYDRMLKRHPKNYADKLVDRVRDGEFKKVIEEIQREGRGSAQAARARRAAASKQKPVRHSDSNQKPHKPKPKRNRSQQPADSGDAADGEDGG